MKDDLDERHLFVEDQPKLMQILQNEVDKWTDENSFIPEADEK